MKKRTKKKGFTLIELIVVIAILGILAAVAIPRFAGITDSARDKANYSAAASLASAAETYCVDKGATTVDVATLITNNYLRGAATDYSKYTLTVTSGQASVTLVGAEGTLATGATLFPHP